MDEEAIRVALAECAERLLALPGVVGVARGERDGRPCITVLVVEARADLVAVIPPAVQGYPLVIVATGPLRSRAEPSAPC